MSHYDEEIDKSLKWLHFHFLYARDIRAHSSYDVLIGNNGRPIIAKTPKIEFMPISLNLQYEKLGYILW